MSDSEHELPTREPASITFEAEYWLAVLADLSELSGLVPPIATAVVDIPIAVIDLALGADPKVVGAAIGQKARLALNGLERLGDPIDRLIALAGGRVEALRAEAGLPPLEAEEL